MLKSLLPITGGLALAGTILVLAIYAVPGLVASSVAAAPAAQGIGTGLGPFGTTNQNNCSAYMASYGYRVDAVGQPDRPDGTTNTDQAVMIMPVQSTGFQPGRDETADARTRRQLSLGFRACAQFYPGVPLIGIGLEQGQSILMYTATATDVLALQNGTLSTEAFWTQVGTTKTLLDARTGRPITVADFVNKDFSGGRGVAAILPPNMEPPSKGKPQIRVQVSTAYVTRGGSVDLVATVLDSSGLPFVGRAVSFTYTPIQSDPLAIGSVTTGPDGTARIRFTTPQSLLGAVLVGASTSDSTGAFNASVPVTIGLPASGAGSIAPSRIVGGIPLPTEPVSINLAAQPVTGTASISVITASLRLQGYTIVDSGDALRYLPDTPTTLVAEILAPRFDLSVRAEILSMAGTLLSTYPTAQSSEPALIYRSQSKLYLMQFHVERSDLESWLAGSINEATLWERIELRSVIDVGTGMSVSTRDFVYKNFAGAITTNVFVSSRQVSSSIVQESWGDQLSTGRFQVPIDSTADTFDIAERTTGSEFAIFASTDPIHPLYVSSGDADGSRLRALRLAGGQYLLSITVGAAPSVVSLSYLERLGNAAGTP